MFRATSGGLNRVAGPHYVQNVPVLQTVNVTDKIAGHMSYRMFISLIPDQLGFPVSADYFDEFNVCCESMSDITTPSLISSPST